MYLRVVLWHAYVMPSGTKPPVGPLALAVGRIIRGHLARIGWTHGQLGERVGVSKAQMSRMLRGDKHMDVDLLYRITQVLGMDIVEDVWRDAEAVVVARESDSEISDEEVAAGRDLLKRSAAEEPPPEVKRRKAV